MACEPSTAFTFHFQFLEMACCLCSRKSFLIPMVWHVSSTYLSCDAQNFRVIDLSLTLPPSVPSNPVPWRRAGIWGHGIPSCLGLGGNLFRREATLFLSMYTCHFVHAHWAVTPVLTSASLPCILGAGALHWRIPYTAVTVRLICKHQAESWLRTAKSCPHNTISHPNSIILYYFQCFSFSFDSQKSFPHFYLWL